MAASVSTSTDNVYNIMSQPSASMKNVDSQKAMSIGPELQQGVQETKQAASKGATENFKASLYKINILV